MEDWFGVDQDELLAENQMFYVVDDSGGLLWAILTSCGHFALLAFLVWGGVFWWIGV